MNTSLGRFFHETDQIDLSWRLGGISKRRGVSANVEVLRCSGQKDGNIVEFRKSKQFILSHTGVHHQVFSTKQLQKVYIKMGILSYHISKAQRKILMNFVMKQGCFSESFSWIQ